MEVGLVGQEVARGELPSAFSPLICLMIISTPGNDEILAAARGGYANESRNAGRYV